MTARSSDHPSDARPVVLAVDDAPDMLSMLTDIIENAGITALIASSGQGALALAERVQPDVILMDAVMPGLDGFDTCRRIKAQTALAHVPVIFMTGLSDTESVVKGFEAGGVDYIPKPITPVELIARIRVHLANARLAQSARVALDIAGPPLAAVDDAGAILWITPQGADMLTKALGLRGAQDDAWRVALKPQLAGIVARGAGDADIGGALTAAYMGKGAPGEHLFRLADAQAPSDSETLQRALGLTAREAEVLVWIAQGKSNRDVAAILDCSPRTVNKHLEQIYGKLGVDNRTAAAMIAMRRLTGG
jgi:DNA-binding NarL/FixJ family response regulator